MLTQHTLQKLHTLKLTGMLDAFEQQQSQPDTHDLSFEERLGLLVDREMLYREPFPIEVFHKGQRVASHAKQHSGGFSTCPEPMPFGMTGASASSYLLLIIGTEPIHYRTVGGFKPSTFSETTRFEIVGIRITGQTGPQTVTRTAL